MSMTVQAPLAYAAVTRRSPRRVVRRVLLAVALLAACAVTVKLSCRELYYYNRDGVARVIQSSRRLQLDDVYGFEDGPGAWKVVGANAHVRGAPGNTVNFDSPKAGELRNGSHIRIGRIGRYNLHWVEGDAWYTSMDFGRDGEFANLLPFPVRTVDDVAARYDEIVSILAGMPPSGTHRAKDGKVYEY